jgi:hypothetical protein
MCSCRMREEKVESQVISVEDRKSRMTCNEEEIEFKSSPDTMCLFEIKPQKNLGEGLEELEGCGDLSRNAISHGHH